MGRGGELRQRVGDLDLVAFGEVPLHEAAFRRHRAPDVCDPYIRMEPGASTPSLPLRRISTTLARLVPKWSRDAWKSSKAL
jgi:hypothetical protein